MITLRRHRRLEATTFGSGKRRPFLDKLSSTRDRFLLGIAARSIRLKKGYRIVTAASLGHNPSIDRRDLLSQCSKVGLAPKGGIALQNRDGKIIGAWEFTREDDSTLRLVRVATDRTELLGFRYHTNMNISEAMFKCIIRFCKLARIERLEYRKRNDNFERMIKQFEQEKMIGNRMDQNDGTRTYYDIL